MPLLPFRLCGMLKRAFSGISHKSQINLNSHHNEESKKTKFRLDDEVETTLDEYRYDASLYENWVVPGDQYFEFCKNGDLSPVIDNITTDSKGFYLLPDGRRYGRVVGTFIFNDGKMIRFTNTCGKPLNIGIGCDMTLEIKDSKDDPFKMMLTNETPGTVVHIDNNDLRHLTPALDNVSFKCEHEIRNNDIIHVKGGVMARWTVFGENDSSDEYFPKSLHWDDW